MYPNNIPATAPKMPLSAPISSQELDDLEKRTQDLSIAVVSTKEAEVPIEQRTQDFLRYNRFVVVFFCESNKMLQYYMGPLPVDVGNISGTEASRSFAPLAPQRWLR